MTIASDFAARFPGFDTVTRDTYLPIVEPIYQNYYCVDYTDESQEAILNLLAHLMLVESNTGTGPLRVKSSQSAGSVSASFAEGDTNARALFYSTTRYGQTFWHLIMQEAGGGCFV